MEYPREPYYGESPDNGDAVTGHKFYLQRGKYFNPSAVSESVIAERLKELKESLNKEQKQRDRECRKCGSRYFQHKPDGFVICTACMILAA